MPKPAFSRFRAALCCLSLLLPTDMPDCVAQISQPNAVAGPSGAVAFDLPAESLGDALDAYSAATGIEVLSPDGLVARRQSTQVKGAYGPSTALQMLLTDTGLTARYIDSGFFTLSPIARASGPGTAPAPDDQDRFDAYAGMLQQALIQTLCRTPETSPGSYRIIIRLWISPSGTVENPIFLHGTDNKALDAALLGSLNGMNIGQAPPPDLPQPATILIAPYSTGAVGGCPAAGQGG